MSEACGHGPDVALLLRRPMANPSRLPAHLFLPTKPHSRCPMTGPGSRTSQPGSHRSQPGSQTSQPRSQTTGARAHRPTPVLLAHRVIRSPLRRGRQASRLAPMAPIKPESIRTGHRTGKMCPWPIPTPMWRRCQPTVTARGRSARPRLQGGSRPTPTVRDAYSTGGVTTLRLSARTVSLGRAIASKFRSSGMIGGTGELSASSTNRVAGSNTARTVNPFSGSGPPPPIPSVAWSTRSPSIESSSPMARSGPVTAN